MPSRIVYFELPHYLGPNYVEDEACPVYRALRDTVHTLAADCETVLTERMSADDSRAAAFRAHPAIEHDVTREYAFWGTHTEASLDGFGTLSLGMEGRLRIVAIRREHEVWQLTRYEGAERVEAA